MSQGAEPTATGASGSVLPAVVIIAGVALVGVGVALNETGVTAGRICILVGLPVALVGVVLAVLAHRRDHEPAAPAAPSAEACIARAARRHGLTPTKHGMSGTLKRRRVQLAPSGEAIEVSARVKRPLDVGLTVRRSDSDGDVRRLSPSGDAAFDAIYSVRGDEPERAAALLSDRLRALLVGRNVRLDDAGVRVLVPLGDDRLLDEAMRDAVKLASEVERASSRVACASFLTDARAAWMRFAEDSALATADTPLAMWGRISDLEVSARAVRDSFQQVHFELAVDFPESLGRSLSMHPASSSTQFDRSGPPVGHPKFDKFFVLKSKPPEDAARLVGGETREAILTLRDEGVQLRVSDKGLWAWVGFRRDRPEAVPDGLSRMVRIAQRVLENAVRYPKPPERSPSPAPAPPTVEA